MTSSKARAAHSNMASKSGSRTSSRRFSGLESWLNGENEITRYKSTLRVSDLHLAALSEFRRSMSSWTVSVSAGYKFLDLIGDPKLVFPDP